MSVYLPAIQSVNRATRPNPSAAIRVFDLAANSHPTESLDAKFTWNGEPIRTFFVYPPIPVRTMDWEARLDGFDPTPWDSDTPARGPHAMHAHAETEAQAICDLVAELMEWV